MLITNPARALSRIWARGTQTASLIRRSSSFVSDTIEEDATTMEPATKEDLLPAIEKLMSLQNFTTSSLTLDKHCREICGLYVRMDSSNRYSFLETLALRYGTTHSKTRLYAQKYCEVPEDDEASVIQVASQLRTSLTPSYTWLFTHIGRLEGGVKFLVDVRADLFNLLSAAGTDDISLVRIRALNTALKDLLALWFSVGFLQLQRITWQSACDMLQKVSEYEAVHPVRNWMDLKRRVGPARRCFVYTHGSMPSEPIVLLHVALTKGISSNIHSIVSNTRMHSMGDIFLGGTNEDHIGIDTAIFYSITSTQKGLKGIELGNYLIKQVAGELKSEFPSMHQFSSLSPIPGFRSWLHRRLSAHAKGELEQPPLFTNTEIDWLCDHLGMSSRDDIFQSLVKLLDNTNAWNRDEELANWLETPLMRLCARYLYSEKHRGYAFDSVANFHLRNGAVMWRLNWKADLSARGLTNSCGIMVNYRYFLDDCEKNSQQYLESKQIEASDQVFHLAKVAASVLD